MVCSPAETHITPHECQGPLLSLSHIWQDRLRHLHRPKQIRLHLRLHESLRCFFERRAVEIACVVHEHVDATVDGYGFGDLRFDIARVFGDVELENVEFSYPTRPDTRVLKNFSLHAPAGKVTALVGHSGSGKSTIVGLLERWYNPTSGTIKLDGRPISSLNIAWLRKNVRLVQQV